MKTTHHSVIYLAIVFALFISCSKEDDTQPGSSASFVSDISQGWTDTVTNSIFVTFGTPDSAGRFTGNIDGNNFSQNLLSGTTKKFDVKFTVVLDQFSNYIDYSGTLTDTIASHMRMVVRSNQDTLYLKRN